MYLPLRWGQSPTLLQIIQELSMRCDEFPRALITDTNIFFILIPIPILVCYEGPKLPQQKGLSCGYVPA